MTRPSYDRQAAELARLIETTVNPVDTLTGSPINVYLSAAIRHVAEYLGDDLPDPMPEDIQCAVLLLTGDLYVNRERQVEHPIHHNTAYQLLLNPYRSMEVLS